MKSARRVFSVTASVILLVSCMTSQVSNIGGSKRTRLEITSTIAISPSGGLLSDAIAIELSNRGYQVFDTQQTSQIFVRLNLDEMEIIKPEKMLLMKNNGVDVYMQVRMSAGYDGRPQSAVVKLLNTENARIISGVVWQNGWGGQAGSIADRAMRVDLAAAARQIVDNLISNE